ncbi:hypothetical protein ACK6SN_10025 [Proteus mirabilis]|nr:hypothetical protein [Proteus mirabilis]
MHEESLRAYNICYGQWRALLHGDESLFWPLRVLPYSLFNNTTPQ